MSKRLAELCSVLVERAHGEVASQIFSTLANYGRLDLSTLQRFIRIPTRRLRIGLATLIQHHIVLYYAFEEHQHLVTYFSVDWDAAYVLTRSHKLARLVGEREGEAAAKLVANILELGHTRVDDLADALNLASSSKRDSGIDTFEEHVTGDSFLNGIGSTSKHKTHYVTLTTVSEYHLALRTLLDKGYLTKVTDRSHVPRVDIGEQLRETVIAEQFPDRKITGSSKQPKFNAAVSSLKRKWEDEDTYSSTRDVASRGVIKQSYASPGSNKRIKLNGGLPTPNSTHHECEEIDAVSDRAVPKLPDDMVVRVNFAKCTLLLRSQRLEHMVERFLGPVTTAVFRAVLQCLKPTAKIEVKPAKVKLDDDDDDEENLLPSASDLQILDNLDKSIDLASTIKGAASMYSLPNGANHHRDKPHTLSDDLDEAELGIKRETRSDHEDDDHAVDGYSSFQERNKRLKLLEMHLQILAEHPKKFCVRAAGKKESRVDIPALTQTVIQAELDIMINARYGKAATRIVRILREKGKLEEKQIAAMSMLRVKDLRELLTYLQFQGVIDALEVPKDSGRQPARTVYLWFFDEEGVGCQYLQRTYQAMSRSLQRLKVERDGKYKAVIEKGERTDVKGREQERLNWQEKELLREWRDVEERMLVQVARMDDVVALLRDFSGNDTSLAT